MPGADPHTADLRAAVGRHLPRVRDWLEELVRIPSVSDVDGDAPPVRTSAEAVARILGEAGFPEVDVVDEGGRPAVLARHPAPEGAPTVLLYAHHDVQPPGDDADWDSPPFEPTERDGRLYGRGAADDKAGIAVHLAAYLAHDGRPPVGVTVFVEGEEESGSESLPPILDRHRERLGADVFVIADSTNWDVGAPALTTSLRGLVNCVVEVRTLHHGVHSGMWGGVVPDALTTLVRLLATLHDDRGDVAVRGLVSGPASDLDYPHPRLRTESAIRDGVALIGSGSVVERLWTKPAISQFARAYPDAAIVVTGVEDPDTRAHGANESLHLAEFARVCVAEALLLDRLAR